ncbi:MAG: porphobilinogen synthase, partial [Selenomonadaceae bacterium]|nr:porphobilinogen synthase [Selenomonadaceae bacterium]
MFRPRRLRLNENLRSMIRETTLSVKDLIYPIFVVAGENVREEIPSMPDCYHLSVDNAVELAKKIAALGIPSVEVFGLPEYKDEVGSSAWDMNSPVQRAIAAIKKAVPELVIVGDVCLCQYTTHGHCGKLCGHYVDNDETLKLLQKVAV